MKVLIVCLLSSCLLSQAQSIRRIDGTRLPVAEADALARRVFAENLVTGAQVAVLNRGRVAWMSAYGERDAAQHLPMRTDTTTWAASITKGVFATYVMQLSQAGRLPLDTPIADLLPQPLESYAEYKDTASLLMSDARYRKVTPRILLAHASGLANFASLEPDRKMHLHFDPGTRFAYSGEGLNLLQFVIEQREHRPLDELMRSALFAPLRMKMTSMVWNPAFADNVADRYDAEGKFISHTRRDRARGAGSMTTSVEDLARFTVALLGTGSDLPMATSLAEMTKPVVWIDATHQFPTFDETRSKEGPAVGLAYGMGWGLLTKTKFGPAFFKEGHGDGAQNYMICFTRHGDCMILLTNSDNGELAFRALLEGILGDTVTPWVWEGYTPEQIKASREKP